MAGKLFGIGVGPGNPELLTMKAVRAIEALDVIIAPKTEKKTSSVALKIARDYIQPQTEIVYQEFPMTDDFASDDTSWEKNKAEILALLGQGKSVGFLTLGDPMFFSTYIYVLERLKAEQAKGEVEFTIETIPGITAFCAIASATNTPIIEGDNVLSIVPANLPLERVQEALEHTDNAVLMKVSKEYPELLKLLDEQNMVDKAILVSRYGLENEKVFSDIREAQEAKLNYLSTIITRRSK